jgi:ABC-2 type transport system permease protein
MVAKLQAWWTILRICLEERLVYRGDFALGTLMRFIPVITQVFLWTAVFAARGDATIGGFDTNSMIAYLLLTNVSRAFSSMPGLADTIALHVRGGDIKKFLIQPIDMIGFFLLSRVAHKLVYYVIAIGPFALVFFLCRDYFTNGWPSASTLGFFFLSLVLGFLLGFFLEASIGMISFWLMEVSSLLLVFMLFSFFFSGQMFPITALEAVPGPVYQIVDLLPFKYLAYFPAVVFLEKVQGEELIRGLVIEVAWIAFFIVLCRSAFHVGLKRYAGYGG